MSTAGTTVQLRLIGRFVVVRGDEEVPVASFGGRKVRTLLRVLASRRPGLVTTDELSEILWGDRPPADPPANVQVLVNRARRAVGRSELIVTGTGGYALTGAEWCTVDAAAFLAAVDRAGREDGRSALDTYVAALTPIGTLEPLPEDRYESWAAGYRQRVLDARQHAWERAADLALAAGEVAVAVTFAAAAAAAEPLRESAVLTLIRALVASGDRAAALARYDAYRRLLAEELGLDPTPQATELQAAVLRAEAPPAGSSSTRSSSPESMPAGSPSSGSVPPGSATPGSTAPGSTALDAGAGRPVEAADLREPLRLVGRHAEVAWLRGALAQSGTDGPPVVWVQGRSGIGKSRLLQEIATETGAILVRAFWADRDEPWTLARALLRELVSLDISSVTRLAPAARSALGSIAPDIDYAPTSFDPGTRRALITEALGQLCAAAGRVLITDDVQWADPMSLRALAGMVGKPGCPPLILAARPDEVEHASPLADLLRHLPSVRRLDLHPLDASAIADLVTDSDVARAISGGTDGTPLAVTETIRGLLAAGVLRRRADGRWAAVREDAASIAADLAVAGQRHALATRIDQHQGLPRVALRLLAVLGREAPVRTLAPAAGATEPDMLAALTALAAADLVRPGELGWRFAHDVIGEIVFDQLDPAERTGLHAALAPVLDALDGEPAERARQWLGAGDLGRAGGAFALAAMRAADAFADAEAEHLADAGIALGSVVARADRVALLRVRAEVRHRRGAISEARADLQAILDQERGGAEYAVALAELAMVSSGAEDLVRASELAELAVVSAGSSPAARARSLEVASIIDMNLGRPARSAQRADEALASYTELGDSGGAARILDARAMAAFLETDIPAGTELLDRAATLFEDCGDLLRMVTPRSTRGHGLVLMGRPADGLADADRALDTARTLGHQEGIAYALWHRSEALSALGRAEEAALAGADAVRLATRIGHRGWAATGWRAVGLARQAAGALAEAADAFGRSLELSENLDLFRCWAAARAAIVAVGLHRIDEAASLATLAGSLGPALGRHEARWAAAEVAAAVGDPAAPVLVNDAIERAELGGALIYRPRLRELAMLTTDNTR